MRKIAIARGSPLYDFSTARKHVEKQGLVWPAAVEKQLDAEFQRMGLRQGQVDRLIVLHVHYMRFALSGPFLRRAAIALAILLGRV